MSEEIVKYNTKLPTVAELYKDESLTLKNTALAVLLNSEPAPGWVKIHPITKGKYIPIEVVEYLLIRIFGKFRREIKNTELIGNSVVVTVRLWVIDPVTGEWDWQDGVGAAPLQTNAGSGAIDFNALKSAAVMIAAPSAASFAVKDAAENFGKLFGKDLNRKDAQVYDQLSEQAVKRFTKVEERIEKMIQGSKNTDQLNKIRESVNTQNIIVSPELIDLFTAKEIELHASK